MGRSKKNKGAEGEGAEGEGGSQREQHGSGDNDYDLPSSSLLLFSGQLLVTAGSHFHVHDLKYATQARTVRLLTRTGCIAGLQVLPRSHQLAVQMHTRAAP